MIAPPGRMGPSDTRRAPGGCAAPSRCSGPFASSRPTPTTSTGSRPPTPWINCAGDAAVDGRLVVDVGGGAGYFTEAFTAAGARCVLVEPEAGALGLDDPEHDGDAELAADGVGTATVSESVRRLRHRRAVRPGRLAPGRTIAGDGNRLPLSDAGADVVFSSNVLEHIPDPRTILDEMIRVTRPGGTIYLSSRPGTPRGEGTKRPRGTISVATAPPCATSATTDSPPETCSAPHCSHATWAHPANGPRPSRRGRGGRPARYYPGLDALGGLGPGRPRGRHLEPSVGAPPAEHGSVSPRATSTGTTELSG